MLVALVLAGYGYLGDSKPNSWGDGANEPYITISGSKPNDAYLVAWVDFWVTGDECEAYSYDLFGQKAHKGGKISQKITHDYSSVDSNYEFRIPYQTSTNADKCLVELRNFSVEAYNAFDTVGFAQLRVYPSGNDYYNRAIASDSKITAENCRARYYDDLKEWSSGFACSFYTNGKLKNKADMVEFNAYKVYYDFSKFNDDTVIHYDISAGEDYRTEAVDESHGAE